MGIQYIEVKRGRTEDFKDFILERDGFCCRYCGNKNPPFHLDHVYPVAKGGETSVDNIVTACQRCNAEKQATVGIWPKPIGYFDEQKEFQRAKFPYFAFAFFLLATFLTYNGFSTLLNFPDFHTLGVLSIFGGIISGLVGVGCMIGGR